jgi:hypothetical protein
VTEEVLRRSSLLGIVKTVSKIPREGESNLRPYYRRARRKDYISEHRGLARGWLVVNPLRVTEPMVGWKRSPLSVVTSHYLVLISVFILYALN